MSTKYFHDTEKVWLKNGHSVTIDVYYTNVERFPKYSDFMAQNDLVNFSYYELLDTINEYSNLLYSKGIV